MGALLGSASGGRRMVVRSSVGMLEGRGREWRDAPGQWVSNDVRCSLTGLYGEIGCQRYESSENGDEM